MGIFSSLFRSDSVNRGNESSIENLSKEVLLDIINTSTTMMLYFDKTKGFIGANIKFCNELGYRNIHELNRKYDNLYEMFLSQSEEIFTEGNKSWLEYIYKSYPHGYRVKMYNSKQKILDINLKCRKPQSSSKLYILEFEDVTQLEVANVEIKEVEELKTRFLANIGHEFRTPMNGILGFIELLSLTKLEKRQKEYVQLVENSSKNLMSSIETLLDLSQMQGGRLTIDNEDFEIIPHIEELIYHHIIVARDKGIKVLNFIDPKLPKLIHADIRKIKQILNSLIQNAIKFTQNDGRIVVEVKLLKRQVNGDCTISFGVKDNGKGISKHKIASILEPFNSGEHADGRLGVGLSLSHGLVNLLGSELHIISEEGDGSYFNFALDFKGSIGQSYKMIVKKKVKVLLLDNTKIDEANFLSSYLRSFAIDVIKSTQVNEHIYDDVEAVYVIAKQNDSSWMFKLGTYVKKVPVVMLLEEGEVLQTKFMHVIDEVIRTPLFPSKVSQHLLAEQIKRIRLKEKEKHILKEKVSILVVEDNLINQRLIKLMLREYKMPVLIASNGNEAVQMCKENHFDIIFMDIDMPEKNGIEATQEIKQTVKLNEETPIVALTAMAMQGDREMLLSEGLDDYISKPITRDKLESILNKYLKALFV